ncbi:MAG: alpha/beta hydrolase family esterase [Thermoplasmatota archaeon]
MSLLLRFGALAAVILLLGVVANAALFLWGPSPHGRRITVPVDGDDRGALLHVPRGADGPLPLVVALHPHMGFDHQFARVTGLSRLADDEGFAVAYPDATAKVRHVFQGWNAEHCCGHGFRTGADDVAFLDALLDRLVTDGVADPERIYLVGHSNGGMMAYHYASLRPDRVAAIGVVAGSIGSGPTPSQHILAPLPEPSGGALLPPAMLVHGGADDVVPIEGGSSDRADGWSFTSFEQAVDAWRLRLDLPAQPDLAESDGNHRTWMQEGRPVLQAVVVPEAGHSWPGGAPNPFGVKPSQAYDASAGLWAFLRQQRL